MFPHLPPSSVGVCLSSYDVSFGVEVVSSGFSEVGMGSPSAWVRSQMN